MRFFRPNDREIHKDNLGARGLWIVLALFLPIMAACTNAIEDAHGQTSGARVVFIGDSITQYWERDRPAFFKGNGFIGRGIPAQTTADMLKRFQTDVIALEPDAVLIIGGTNDIAGNEGPVTDEQIIGNLKIMADTARSASIRVVIGSIPPSAKFPWNTNLTPAARIAALNSKISAWATAQGIVYVDFWSALAVPGGAINPNYSNDGAHPNAAGFAVMEPIAVAGIQKALAGGHDKN